MSDEEFMRKTSDMLTKEQRSEINQEISDLPDYVIGMFDRVVGTIQSAVDKPTSTTTEASKIIMVSPVYYAKELKVGQYLMGYDILRKQLLSFTIEENIVQNIFQETYRNNMIGTNLPETLEKLRTGNLPGVTRPQQFSLDNLSHHATSENLARLGKKLFAPIDNTVVFKANLHEINKVLGIKTEDIAVTPGYLALGDSLYDAEGDIIPIHLTSNVLTKHLSVVGQSGKGKTILLKSILYDMVNNNYAILATDTQGDLSGQLWRQTLRVEQQEIISTEKMQQMWHNREWDGNNIGISRENLRVFVLNQPSLVNDPMIQVIRNNGFGDIIRPLNLQSSYIQNYVELASALTNLSPAQYEGLESLFGDFMNNTDNPREFFNLREFIDYVPDAVITGLAASTRGKIIQKLNNLNNLSILDVGTDPIQFTTYRDFMQEGVISILYLPDDNSDVRLTKTLVELIIFNMIRSNLSDPENPRRAIVIDEAHDIIPKSGRGTMAGELADRFDQLAVQGRKYGVTLVVASQQPRKIHPTVFSQCTNRIFLGLSSMDLKEVSSYIPSKHRSLILNAKPGYGILRTEDMDVESVPIIVPMSPVYHVDPRILFQEEGVVINREPEPDVPTDDMRFSSSTESEEDTDEF